MELLRRILFVIGVATALVTVCWRNADAVWLYMYQENSTPEIDVFDTPGLLTLYVVLFSDADTNYGLLQEIRFRAPVPSCFKNALYVSDITLVETTEGNSQTGIKIFLDPCDFSGALVGLLKVQIVASGNTSESCTYPVLPHPEDVGKGIVLVNCTGNEIISSTLQVPVLQPPLPVEETTWSQVKALYQAPPN